MTKRIIFRNDVKTFIFLIIILISIQYNREILKKYLANNIKYENIQKYINMTFKNKIRKKLFIGIYTYGLRFGGTERSTSLLMNNFRKVNIFKLFLFTQENIEQNEYFIPDDIKRIKINNNKINNLIRKIKKKKLDIFIYQFPNYNEIKKLKSLKKVKIIFYEHSCFLYWIYCKYLNFKYIYKEYQTTKYLISMIPFANDYLFLKWGIKSILMSNFITYEYNNIIPSDLSSKTILMIGRGHDKLKRFELGIKAMNFIKNNIINCEMKIISQLTGISHLERLVNELKLDNYITFAGYTSSPEIYYKNSSLHIFPTISESFGLVLSETKIYGIPNILVGLDYVTISKGGTIIIYDDEPKTIAKEAIKILLNKKYRNNLGKEARKSMKKFNNDFLLKKWIKLIISIYNGYEYFQKLIDKDIKLNKNESVKILKNQIKLLKMRDNNFTNITIKQLENFTFMENFLN